MAKEVNVIVYPRGFRTVVGDTKITPRAMESYKQSISKSEGDRDVKALYELYVGGSVKVDSWEFRKRVIAIAAKRLKNFRSWLTLQVEHNDHVYGTNYDFLVDTIRFIETGSRDASPMTWLELVLANHEAEAGVSIQRNLYLPMPQGSDADIIARWCQKDGGFMDMLCTLHVFFGSARKRDSNSVQTN